MKKTSTFIGTSEKPSGHSLGVDSFVDGGMEEQPSLDLIRKLCKELDAEGIVYCHWKSTAALDRSATGKNDLDLLVSHSDAQRFTEALYRFGFIEAKVPAEQQVPVVLNYYGHDEQADRLVHVHACYQLILGHDLTKNYRLPIERPFLESAIQEGLFKIPAPEFELIVFVIRMVLKHLSWDSILVLERALSTTERTELQHLTSRADKARIADILREELPSVSAALFAGCLRSVQPACSIWTQIKVGHQLQRRLRPYARRSQIKDVFLKVARRVIWTIRRHVHSHMPKKRPINGGAIVALVGGDGAGKSTAADELYSWLSKDFETIKLHLGKPTWSWTTTVVRGILKIGRSLGFYPYVRSPNQNSADPRTRVFPGYPWLLREVCMARDRYLTYVKARRFASEGGFAICDRFPLTQVKSMDGLQPDLRRDLRRSNRLIEFMVRAGEKYYQQIMQPDVLIVLRVDPEIAVRRKTDEDATSVRSRSREIYDLDWRQTPAHVIDASRSHKEVLSEVKALIWSEL